MANSIDFPERNDHIGKQENMSNNQVYALPVCRFLTFIPGVIDRAPAQQTFAHVSCWELTEEELEEVKRTRKVYLKVIGTSTFPVSIHGKLPLYPGDGNLADKVFTREEIEEMKRRAIEKNKSLVVQHGTEPQRTPKHLWIEEHSLNPDALPDHVKYKRDESIVVEVLEYLDTTCVSPGRNDVMYHAYSTILPATKDEFDARKKALEDE